MPLEVFLELEMSIYFMDGSMDGNQDVFISSAWWKAIVCCFLGVSLAEADSFHPIPSLYLHLFFFFIWGGTLRAYSIICAWKNYS